MVCVIMIVAAKLREKRRWHKFFVSFFCIYDFVALSLRAKDTEENEKISYAEQTCEPSGEARRVDARGVAGDASSATSPA